jgi:hypothetical protein
MTQASGGAGDGGSGCLGGGLEGLTQVGRRIGRRWAPHRQGEKREAVGVDSVGTMLFFSNSMLNISLNYFGPPRSLITIRGGAVRGLL